MQRMVKITACLAFGLLVGIAGVRAAEDGKALFDAKCAMCHGKDGVAKPMAKGAANLNDTKFQEANSTSAIEKIIADGKGKMKGLKEKLTPEQIKLIAAHVKTLK